MATLTKVLSKQQARTMAAVTRKGDDWYVSGSTGIIYIVRPVLSYVGGQPDEVHFTCNCPAASYYHGECKHGKLIRAKYENNEVRDQFSPHV